MPRPLVRVYRSIFAPSGVVPKTSFSIRGGCVGPEACGVAGAVAAPVPSRRTAIAPIPGAVRVIHFIEKPPSELLDSRIAFGNAGKQYCCPEGVVNVVVIDKRTPPKWRHSGAPRRSRGVVSTHSG
jgi:hypothetical protein